MLRKRAHTTEQSVIRLCEEVTKFIQDRGEALDQNFQSDLLEIMVDNQEKVKSAYPHGSKVTDDCFISTNIVMLYVHQSYNFIISALN